MGSSLRTARLGALPDRLTSVKALLLLVLLAGCRNGDFETPQLLGRAALIHASGSPQLWVMTKQEEQRRVGSRRINARLRTFFHFQVEAFDPVNAESLWKQRVLTLGNPERTGPKASLVIGSDVDGRLLGQDGDLVWLLIGEAPYALRASDGSIAVDADALQRINPQLKGLLPSEAKYFGFDRGLVIMTADAQQFVVRGTDHTAVAYTPPPPVAEPEGPLRANGTRELVPLVPYGDVPARHVTLGEKRLFLYTAKEAADAASDEWGQHLRWPYTVLNEGKLARRTFLEASIESVQRFEDRYERISGFTPVAGAPTFLSGRFAKDPATGNARVLESPQSVLVWHSTRIDDAGRIAVARLDANLATLWTAELPLSESNFSSPIATWWLPTHLVVVGSQQLEEDGATSQVPYLVSIELKSGSMRSTRIAE